MVGRAVVWWFRRCSGVVPQGPAVCMVWAVVTGGDSGCGEVLVGDGGSGGVRCSEARMNTQPRNIRWWQWSGRLGVGLSGVGGARTVWGASSTMAAWTVPVVQRSGWQCRGWWCRWCQVCQGRWRVGGGRLVGVMSGDTGDGGSGGQERRMVV